MPQGELPKTRAAERRVIAAIAALVALGLVLRILAAQGALWLDEAWSAYYAQAARTPLGVFTAINHDNNHHLNTLWLQLVGPDAPPMVQRALSILCGTATIAVAGAIGARRGAGAAIITAALFALSPILVSYGAEARGYSPMLLVLLIAVLVTAMWLNAPARPAPARPLFYLFVLGTLAQMTMVFGLAALAAWVAWRSIDRGVAGAVRTTLRLLAPAMIAVAVVIAAIVGIGEMQPGGFHVGNYVPFSAAGLALGLGQAAAGATGVSLPLPLLAIAILAMFALRRRDATLGLYAAAIIAFPLCVALFRLGNVEHARYYLVAVVALLLMLGTTIGEALHHAGWRRLVAAGALLVIAVAAARGDHRIVAELRGDPGRALAIMRAAAPGGTTVAIGSARDAPVLELAARRVAYPLAITQRPCPAAAFAFVDAEDRDFHRNPVLCGARYRRAAVSVVRGPSGMGWTLYARR